MRIKTIQRDRIILANDDFLTEERFLSDDIQDVLDKCPKQLMSQANKNEIYLDQTHITYYRLKKELKITYQHKIQANTLYASFDLRNVCLLREEILKVYFKDIFLKGIIVDSWLVPTISIIIQM